mmetsp:Transcript_120759/g.286873  ORF Transcript_120759/g.286873 Transcript_120759/m.286873 type:complete len:290 (+) Transcript_120759:497-1366(+)
MDLHSEDVEAFWQDRLRNQQLRARESFEIDQGQGNIGDRVHKGIVGSQCQLADSPRILQAHHRRLGRRCLVCLKTAAQRLRREHELTRHAIGSVQCKGAVVVVCTVGSHEGGHGWLEVPHSDRERNIGALVLRVHSIGNTSGKLPSGTGPHNLPSEQNFQHVRTGALVFEDLGHLEVSWHHAVYHLAVVPVDHDPALRSVGVRGPCQVARASSDHLRITLTGHLQAQSSSWLPLKTLWFNVNLIRANCPGCRDARKWKNSSRPSVIGSVAIRPCQGDSECDGGKPAPGG